MRPTPVRMATDHQSTLRVSRNPRPDLIVSWLIGPATGRAFMQHQNIWLAGHQSGDRLVEGLGGAAPRASIGAHYPAKPSDSQAVSLHDLTMQDVNAEPLAEVFDVFHGCAASEQVVVPWDTHYPSEVLRECLPHGSHVPGAASPVKIPPTAQVTSKEYADGRWVR